MLYFNFIDDVAITSNIINCEIEKRLYLMLVFEDLSILLDLQINNSFRKIKFDIF